MRGFAINGLEEPDKMEFGKVGFVGNIIQVNLFVVIMVNIELGLYNAVVEIVLGICVIRL
jgi:hypothetical protein